MKIKGQEENFEYLDDVKRIHLILVKKGHYDATLQQARELWNLYSESMAAGWMMLDDDDDMVYANISYYIEN